MNSKDVSALMAASAEDRAAAFEEGRRAGLEEARQVADSLSTKGVNGCVYDEGWDDALGIVEQRILALKEGEE